MEVLDKISRELEKINADDYVISQAKSNASHVKFANSKIVKTGVETLNLIDLFVVKKKRIVTTSIHKTDDKNIKETVQKVKKFLKLVPENKNYVGIAEGPFKYIEIDDSYDKRVGKEDIVEHVEKAISVAESLGIKRCAGVLDAYDIYLSLLTSNNVRASDKATKLYFSIRCHKTKDASGHMTACSRVLSKFDTEKVAEHAARIASLGKGKKNLSPGNYDIIFEPLPMADLLNTVMDSASIFSVEANISFFKGLLNKKVASSKVTLADDATMRNGFNSAMFDQEGVPTQRTEVIKNGILKSFLHNTSTAKRHKTKTTANAGLISPSPFNIVLEPGDFRKDEIFREMKRGLYITNLWYTRFQNYATGDFSTIPRDGAFIVENGEIKQAVKNIRISENILNLLKNVSALGRKSYQIKSWEAETPVTLPLTLVKNCRITKPEN
ncbi:TldD/PmbA family protein [Candidatus Woesearchaeota archaeon]|nr:MAG: TldD/PmbA family protein [Candidatus Woesearchaeota archaeon]